MTRMYTMLAVGVLLLSGAAVWAGEPVAPPVAYESSQAAPACGCGSCGAGHNHGSCYEKLKDWLTYCPPRTPCHFGCGSCSSCGSGGGCSCTPCCTPLYMYFLDRCSPTFGFQPGGYISVAAPVSASPYTSGQEMPSSAAAAFPPAFNVPSSQTSAPEPVPPIPPVSQHSSRSLPAVPDEVVPAIQPAASSVPGAHLSAAPGATPLAFTPEAKNVTVSTSAPVPVSPYQPVPMTQATLENVSAPASPYASPTTQVAPALTTVPQIPGGASPYTAPVAVPPTVTPEAKNVTVSLMVPVPFSPYQPVPMTQVGLENVPAPTSPYASPTTQVAPALTTVQQIPGGASPYTAVPLSVPSAPAPASEP